MTMQVSLPLVTSERSRPASRDSGRGRQSQAIYLGPMSQVVDDFGTVFTRGVPTPVNVDDWQRLSKRAASGSFLLLMPEDQKNGACCDEPAAVNVGLTRL